MATLPTTDAKVTGSPQFSLSKNDYGKIAKGAGIALGGALLTWLAAEVLPKLDDTEYAWLGAIAAIMVNVARMWLTNSQAIEIPLTDHTVIVTPQEVRQEVAHAAAQPAPVAPPQVIVVTPAAPPGPPP